jgi:hypothetical protein
MFVTELLDIPSCFGTQREGTSGNYREQATAD